MTTRSPMVRIRDLTSGHDAEAPGDTLTVDVPRDWDDAEGFIAPSNDERTSAVVLSTRKVGERCMVMSEDRDYDDPGEPFMWWWSEVAP